MDREIEQPRSSDSQLRLSKAQLQFQQDNGLMNYGSESDSPTKFGGSIGTFSFNKDLYSDDEMKKFTIQGIISLIGGILLHLELGTFYVWGSISPYVAAWMREKDKDVTLNLMSVIFPILGVITMSVLSFGIKIAERVGFKLTIGVGSITISLAFLIISFVQNMAAFMIIYCIMVGISGGLLYMLPIICGWRYFPNRRGLVSGLTIGGYGFGSFIFNFVCRAIANPKNLAPELIQIESNKPVKYFTKEVGDKVPEMFQVLAGCYLILAIISTLMIRYPSEIDPDKMQATLTAQQLRHRKYGHPAPPPPALPPNKECQEIFIGIKSVAFVLLISIVLTSCTLSMMISNCYKFYGLELGFNDAMLTATGSVAGVMNGASRFFWAALTDKTSFKFTFTIIAGLNLVTSASLPFTNNELVYMLLIATVYLAQGGLLATYPVICAKIYGNKIGGLMYGFMFFMVGVSNMLGYILYSLVRVELQWKGVFMICFLLNIVGMGLGIILKEVGYDWRPNYIIQKEKEQQEMQPIHCIISSVQKECI